MSLISPTALWLSFFTYTLNCSCISLFSFNITPRLSRIILCCKVVSSTTFLYLVNNLSSCIRIRTLNSNLHYIRYSS